MSLVTFVKGIDVLEAQRFVNVLETGLMVVGEVVNKLKDDGRLSGREGLEILGKALDSHGICVECSGEEAALPPILDPGGVCPGCHGGGLPPVNNEPVAQRPAMQPLVPANDEVRYPLRLKDAQTPAKLASQMASLSAVVDKGVCLTCDGDESYRVNTSPVASQG